MIISRVTLVFACMLLCACTHQQVSSGKLHSIYLQDKGGLGECARLFADVDALSARVDSVDAQASRLPGYPYLRSNRFLASFRDELDEPIKLQQWLQALRQLDREARQYEIQNSATLAGGFTDRQELLARLDTCAESLMEKDLLDVRALNEIKQAAKVDDNYSTAQRITGLYPLTSWFVKQGIERLQQEVSSSFSSLSNRSVPVINYGPADASYLSAEEIRDIFQASRDNALAIPVLTDRDQERLFRHFAPVWQVEAASDDDHIGAPYWLDRTRLAVNIDQPVVYRLLSHTRVENQVLAQLNYIIWFPARTVTSSLDLLAGHLDGITLRVTLDADGNLLMLDSMHNCGCYHMFFPVSGTGLTQKPQDSSEETLLVPKQPSAPLPGERIHVRIAAVSHYIEGIESTKPGIVYRAYQFENYNNLRSLAVADGKYRSMFGVDGIVAGSERKERWILWPMGVRNAGAMRQWGKHATAFIGRRHFDDADLLTRYFRFP